MSANEEHTSYHILLDAVRSVHAAETVYAAQTVHAVPRESKEKPSIDPSNLIPELKKLVNEYAKPDELDLKIRQTGISTPDLLKIACKLGRIDFVRSVRLGDLFQFGDLVRETKEPNMTIFVKEKSRKKYDLLVAASEYNRVDIIRELKEHWGLTRDDAQLYDNWLLLITSAYGYVDVLKEFRINWGLTTEDVTLPTNGFLHKSRILHKVAANGHVNVLVEFRTNWNINRDMITFSYRMVEDAAKFGHVRVLIELRVGWGFTKENVEGIEDCNIVGWAAENGHVNVLRELRVGWGLKTSNARAFNDWALRFATKNYHDDVLAELSSNWGVG